MERLTKRSKYGIAYFPCENCTVDYEESHCEASDCMMVLADRLAAYEDAEEKGLLVRLSEDERKEFEKWKTERAKH